MLPMSSPQINPGGTETQQMRVTAPAGVRIDLVISVIFVKRLIGT